MANQVNTNRFAHPLVRGLVIPDNWKIISYHYYWGDDNKVHREERILTMTFGRKHRLSNRIY